jgi:hypothetical protein
MSHSRRRFLEESAIAGFLLPLLAHEELLDAQGTKVERAAPTAGEIFWKQLYGTEAERGRVSATPAPDRDPVIAQFDAKVGLRWAQDIDVTELASFTDDAIVSMEMTGFRPGSQDKTRLAKVRFAQLHLSCERKTGSEFLGPLAWVALATIFTSKVSQLPAATKLTWSSLAGGVTTAGATPANGQTQSSSPQISHAVLNQGIGHMSINLTATPLTSLLDKIVSVVVQSGEIIAPLLGFPGITLPALQTFYTFYGQLEKSLPSDFLINGARQDVVVTQQGANSSAISAKALKLMTGTYILVPKAHETDLNKELANLVVQNGYLVERDSKLAPDARVAEAVPTVSYVTLNIKIEDASKFQASSTVVDPLLDAPPKPNSKDPK